MLVHTIHHWRPYLYERYFLARTDHYSLNFLLDQRVATIHEHLCVGTLLGFNFTVEYKPGTSNMTVDALSHYDGLRSLCAPV